MDYSQINVLIVDDSAMSRELIATIFNRLRVNHVDKALNGRAGLDKICEAYSQGRPYGLITLDWEMPEMTGLEVLREVRANPLTKDAPILLITSVATEDAVKRAAHFRPLGYIVKPFTDQTFKEKLAQIFP